MSEETNAKQMLLELLDEVKYAVTILGTGREALLASKIAKAFDGEPPRLVMMHAISRALTDPEVDRLEDDKFLRGLIALCLYFLEDEDVNLALKIKNELHNIDGQ